MTDKIAFDLVSPERLLISETADMVTVPGVDGYMGVMSGHEPLVSTLRAGMLDVSGGSAGGEQKFFIRGGFAEVSASKITVLAEEAIPMTEFDLAVLDQRISDAEEVLAAAKTEAERSKAHDQLADLRMVRAAF